MDIVNFTYKQDGIFNLTYKPITREMDSWMLEIDNTTKNIAKSTTKPIFLCFSGGIDSEVVALSLIKNNIDFTILTVKHTEGTNSHDIHYTYEFCKKHNIKQVIVDLDVTEFFTNGIKDYIQQGYKAIRIFRYLQLFILETVEKMGGCAILCSGEQVYCNIEGEICLNRDLGYMMALEWCKNNNTLHYPYFFEQNSELFASYMKLDLIDYLIKDPTYFTNYIDNMSTEKIIIYHKYWPNMKKRNKYHGFERIHPLKNKMEAELRKLFPEIVPIFFPISKIKQQLGI